MSEKNEHLNIIKKKGRLGENRGCEGPIDMEANEGKFKEVIEKRTIHLMYFILI